MDKRRRIIFAVMLLLSTVNYSRIKGNENIRPIQFISILVIGALTGVLVYELVRYFKSKNNNS